MKRQLIVVLGMVATLGITSNADLIDRGSGLIYDDVLDITWLQNANYAQTSGYDSTGLMNWSQAMAWAVNLEYYDSVRQVTWTDWRLPHILPVNGMSYDYNNNPDGSSDNGYNIGASGSVYPNSTGSEMGYMYYTNLGNLGYQDLNGNEPQLGWGLNNVSFESGGSGGEVVSFHNVQAHGAYTYWSENKPVGISQTDRALYFSFINGYQSYKSEYGRDYAWAVRDGDVIPLPLSANAGGPYFLDIAAQEPIMLGGSVEGEYGEAAWDLDGDGLFDDAQGLNPLISASMVQSWGFSPGMTWDIGLHVTGLYGHVDTSMTELSFVPVPGAVILGSMGLGMVGWRCTRKTT